LYTFAEINAFANVGDKPAVGAVDVPVPVDQPLMFTFGVAVGGQAVFPEVQPAIKSQEAANAAGAKAINAAAANTFVTWDI